VDDDLVRAHDQRPRKRANTSPFASVPAASTIGSTV
jgi:hypothetical protein